MECAMRWCCPPPPLSPSLCVGGWQSENVLKFPSFTVKVITVFNSETSPAPFCISEIGKRTITDKELHVSSHVTLNVIRRLYSDLQIPWTRAWHGINVRNDSWSDASVRSLWELHYILCCWRYVFNYLSHQHWYCIYLKRTYYAYYHVHTACASAPLFTLCLKPESSLLWLVSWPVLLSTA